MKNTQKEVENESNGTVSNDKVILLRSDGTKISEPGVISGKKFVITENKKNDTDYRVISSPVIISIVDSLPNDYNVNNDEPNDTTGNPKFLLYGKCNNSEGQDEQNMAARFYYVDNSGETYYPLPNFTIEDPSGGKDLELSDANGYLCSGFIIEDIFQDIIITSEPGGNTVKYKCFDGNIISPVNDETTNDTTNNGEDVGPYTIKAIPISKVGRLSDGENKCILKGGDLYLDAHSRVKGVEFVIEKGRLIRYHKCVDLPLKITCKGGNFVDEASDYQKLTSQKLTGVGHTYIKNIGKACSTSLVGGQYNVVEDIDLKDFLADDTFRKGSFVSLNKVLNSIFRTSYNPIGQYQRMVIKLPEEVKNTTNFCLEHSLVIPHNVKIDMSGANLYVCSDFIPKAFSTDTGGYPVDGYPADSNGNYINTNDINMVDTDYVISFGTNKTHPINAESVFDNVNIIVENLSEVASAKVKKIYDLTHFTGIMENVTINLNTSTNTEIIALWQQFGDWTVSYSDQKIIRRCNIYNCGKRTKTPTVLFCLGDGCIIEQCHLGYVAILCGKSYSITGCLNDKYFLFDTTVNFGGSHWNSGQFQILESKVTFSNCQLEAANNLFHILNDTIDRVYIGPWMAIDTQGCRDQLMHLIKDYGLDLDKFNEIVGCAGYLGRATDFHSVVKFDETVRHRNVYWGYCQPMSSALIVKGEAAEIVGIKNIETPNYLFIHNYINADNFDGTIPVIDSSWLPLVNGDFADVNTDVELPESLTISWGDLKVNDDNVHSGLLWNDVKLSNVKARILLDKQRKLYSKQYVGNGEIETKNGSYPIITIYADMSKKKYSNLKVELLFTMQSGGTSKNYKLKKHFYRTIEHGFYDFGENKLNPVKNTYITVAQFWLARVANDLNNLFDYYSNSDLEKPKRNKEQEKYVERNSNFDADIVDYNEDALCDYCGNIYAPCTDNDDMVNICYRVQWLDKRNIRVYMIALPTVGDWSDGDEVVLRKAVYRYFNGSWNQIMSGGTYHNFSFYAGDTHL